MGYLNSMFSATAPTSPTAPYPNSAGNNIGSLGSAANTVAPTSVGGGYSLANGARSQYNPANNYMNSGMSQSQYESMYGNPNQQGAAHSAATAAGTVQGNNAANNPAINPTMGLSSLTAPSSSSGPTYGTQSGPGILQQWFDQRAGGTDPGWEYGLGRAQTALNNQYASRGAFDSGAALQGQGDMLSNALSQREGQLDQLAHGASAENANQVSQMLGFGNSLAGGESGLAGQYDLGAGGAMTSANNTGLSLSGQAAMIPYLAQAGMMQNLMGIGGGLLGSL